MHETKSKNLVDTLDRPGSKESWLLGAQYSRQYMIKLRIKATPKTTPSPHTAVPNRKVHSLASKSKSSTSISMQEKKAAPIVSPRSPLEAEAGREGEKEVPVFPELPATTAGKKTPRRHKPLSAMSTSTRDGQKESHENQGTRDLLIESYYRMKDANSYTGSFPALLTPYQRLLWTYETVNEPKDELTATALHPSQVSHTTLLFKDSNKKNNASSGSRCGPLLSARVHPPSGPSAFFPTPTSYRWKTVMR